MPVPKDSTARYVPHHDVYPIIYRLHRENFLQPLKPPQNSSVIQRTQHIYPPYPPSIFCLSTSSTNLQDFSYGVVAAFRLSFSLHPLGNRKNLFHIPVWSMSLFHSSRSSFFHLRRFSRTSIQSLRKL